MNKNNTHAHTYIQALEMPPHFNTLPKNLTDNMTQFLKLSMIYILRQMEKYERYYIKVEYHVIYNVQGYVQNC